jgi:hypothetical protein
MGRGSRGDEHLLGLRVHLHLSQVVVHGRGGDLDEVGAGARRTSQVDPAIQAVHSREYSTVLTIRIYLGGQVGAYFFFFLASVISFSL